MKYFFRRDKQPLIHQENRTKSKESRDVEINNPNAATRDTRRGRPTLGSLQ